MYQGLPSTSLLRQLSYVIPYFTHEQFFWFDLVTLHRWKLSEKSRSLFCSSQLLIDDFIACDSCWSILFRTIPANIHGLNFKLLI